MIAQTAQSRRARSKNTITRTRTRSPSPRHSGAPLPYFPSPPPSPSYLNLAMASGPNSVGAPSDDDSGRDSKGLEKGGQASGSTEIIIAVLFKTRAQTMQKQRSIQGVIDEAQQCYSKRGARLHRDGHPSRRKASLGGRALPTPFGPSPDSNRAGQPPYEHLGPTPLKGMASEEQVKTLIAEAIEAATKPGGAIYNSVVERITEQLTTATLPGGTVYAAVEESAKPGGVVHTAFTNEYNRAADQEYPWRAVLRSLTVSQWKATWEALTVDPDSVEAAGEAIEKSGNPAASLWGLSAAHPENKELEALKTRVAMKHAVRTKWKDLCLPERGGSSEKFRCHLGERAEAGKDQNVRALSRCVLVLYHLTEKRYTSVLTGTQANAAKAEAQRATVMEWVYYAIKAFKKRTLKPSAARAFDHEILLKDFGLDLVFGGVALLSTAAGQSRANDLKRLGADSPQSASKARRLGDPSGTTASAGHCQSAAAGPDPRVSSGARANRWSNVPAVGPQAAPPQAAPGTPPAPGRKELVRQMRASLAAVAPGKPAQFFQKWFDERFNEKGLKQAALQVSREVCKNCLYSGRGVFEHTFKECRDTFKNKCVLPCPRCVAAGRLTGNLYHWAQDCEFS